LGPESEPEPPAAARIARRRERTGGCTRCSCFSSRRTWPRRRCAGRGEASVAAGALRRNSGWMIFHCVSGRSLVWVWQCVLLAMRLADGRRKGRHQDEEGTRPLPPGMEGSMAGREPFADPLFVSQDLLPASKTLSTRRKTPLVLPRKLSGERRKGSGFAQPPEPGPLPRRGP